MHKRKFIEEFNTVALLLTLQELREESKRKAIN